ncbi:MAG: hypothetical protein ABR597_06810 [Bacteroidales bacterium]
MEKFERNIQERFRNFEAEPPQDAWQAIEGQLVKKSGSKFTWYRVAAAVAFLIASIISLWLLWPDMQISDPLAGSSAYETPIGPQPIYFGENDNTERSMNAGIGMKTGNTPSILLAESSDASEMMPDATTTIDATPDELNTLVYNNELASIGTFPGEFLHRSDINRIFAENVLNDQQKSFLADLNVESDVRNGQSVFSLSGYLMPQQSFRYQGSSAPFPYETLESNIFTFALGMRFQYSINERWNIESGVGYNLIGQAINDIAAFSHPSMIPLYSTKGDIINSHPQSMSTSMGAINFTDQSFYFADITSSRIFTLKGSYDESNVNLLNKTSSGLIQHFGYLEVPVIFRYLLVDRLLSVSVKSGIAANFLLTNNVYLQGSAYTRSIGESTGVSPISWSGISGVSFDYPVSDRIRISLEPTFTMFLTSMGQFRNLTRDTYPYTYSLFMGVKYDL